VAPTYGYDHANISIKGPIRLGGLVFAQLHTPRFGDARTVGCGPQLQPFTLISNVIDGSGTLRAACGGTIALKKGLGEVTLAHFDCQTTIVQATRTMHIPLSLSVQFYWTPLLDALDAVIEPAPPAYRFFSFTGTWIRD
jgi:hypothetical protein